jgi:hypothetical protein
MGPGFYDDAQTNPSGDLFPAYGPNNATWTTSTGTAVTTALDRTRHNASRFGAHVTFQVEDANAITLHHRSSTSTQVRVCVTESAGGDVPLCVTSTLVGQTSTTFSDPVNLFDDGVTAYNVSITSLSHGQALYVDAIGVHDTTGNLTEGVYQENHPHLTCTDPLVFTGTWSSVSETTATDARACSTGTGDSDSLSFTFDGTGFSILLSQSTTTSLNYAVELDPGDNIITADVMTALPTSTTKKLVALTYVGLTNGTYTVTLTNNDATKPLLVDRVDILGDTTTDIASGLTSNVENTDRRIRYLPFGSLFLASASGASGGSQHTGAVQGSVIYFEYDGEDFEYVRQINTAFGVVDICFNAIGTALTDASCSVVPQVSNALGTAGYQKTQLVDRMPPPASPIWVAIRNTDGKTMPFDYVRPTTANNLALAAGYYEQNFPNLRYFDETSGTGAGPFNLLPAGDDGNFVDVSSSSYSGGTAKSLSADAVTPGNGLYEGVFFRFTGTGFSVYFTLDSKADEVHICWLDDSGGTATVSDVLAGTCQTYDNQSSTARHRAARTILGLQSDTYAVVVQMRPDNLAPSAHGATALPITMLFDAVQIYDQDPATLLTAPLDTLNTRYQNSFVNAAADNRFLYFGTGWSSVNSTSYSGGSYDRNLNVIGAGMVFQTNNADAIVLYRDTASGYPALEVCTINGTARRCVTVPNSGGTGRSQPFGLLLNTTGNTGAHIVTVTTLGYGTFILDAVEIVDSDTVLTVGMYEEYHPALTYSETLNANGVNVNSQWTPIHSSSYSNGRMMQTTTLPTLDSANPPNPTNAEGSLVFEFTGTGFEVGTLVDRYGGEVLVCYELSATVTTPLDIDEFCYRYQNESSTTRATVSRSVAGLDVNTYSVRVQNVEDGMSNLTSTPVARVAPYNVPRLRVDYVRVFNATLPVVTQPGWYNENAADGSGAQFLQLLPTERWARFTGSAAAAFSNRSYYGVVGTSTTSASTAYAGPVATLLVDVPASDDVTVVLYTGAASSSNTDKLLVCAEDVDETPATTCAPLFSLRTQNQVVLNSSNLPALGNNGTVVPLTFRALNAGYFKIDGFQVIHGTTLAPGLYDSVLASDGGLLNTAPLTWSTLKTSSAYNGSLVRMNTANGAMNFTFDGTGFSVITHYDTYAVDMAICWVQGTGGFAYPLDAAGETCEFIGAVSSLNGTNPNINSFNVSAVAINTASAEIRGVIANGTRVRVLATFVDEDGPGGNPGEIVASEVWVIPTTSNYRYGFAYYGLAPNTYSAQVRHIDTSTTSLNFLRVDAVAVFGSEPAAMAPGLYDDAVAPIAYGPEPFWIVTTNTTYGPPKGPYSRTEHTTTNYGSIAQINVGGNGMILYQTARSAGSRNVRICLVVPGQPNECSDFSQNTSTARYFTPIAFFGFGPNDHQIVIEQRNHGSSNNLSVDGVRILP